MITDKSCLVDYYDDFLKLEKKLFGMDFDYSVESITEWFNSPYSLLCLKDGDNNPDSILAYGSLIIISRDSYEKIVSGQITEEELQPIDRPSGLDVAYFASIYSRIPHGASLVVDTAKVQLEQLMADKNLNIDTIFSIASTSRGRKFIEKQGWQQTHLYLDKYPILSYSVSEWLNE